MVKLLDMEPEGTSEERILKAAGEVFLEKGIQGARMQEIADRAGINKALLHYYFQSKEKLLDLILVSFARSLFSTGSDILNSDLPLQDSYLLLPCIPGNRAQ